MSYKFNEVNYGLNYGSGGAKRFVSNTTSVAVNPEKELVIDNELSTNNNSNRNNNDDIPYHGSSSTDEYVGTSPEDNHHRSSPSSPDSNNNNDEDERFSVTSSAEYDDYDNIKHSSKSINHPKNDLHLENITIKSEPVSMEEEDIQYEFTRPVAANDDDISNIPLPNEKSSLNDELMNEESTSIANVNPHNDIDERLPQTSSGLLPTPDEAVASSSSAFNNQDNNNFHVNYLKLPVINGYIVFEHNPNLMNFKNIERFFISNSVSKLAIEENFKSMQDLVNRVIHYVMDMELTHLYIFGTAQCLFWKRVLPMVKVCIIKRQLKRKCIDCDKYSCGYLKLRDMINSYEFKNVFKNSLSCM